jgi:hypothetical protein
MNYLVVAAIFLELDAAVEWLELPGIEDRTAKKAARMAVTTRIAVL